MAIKTTVSGRSFIINTGILRKTYDRALQIDPQAATLIDADENVVFVLSATAPAGINSISLNAPSTNDNGFMYATLPFPANVAEADRVAYIEQKYARQYAGLVRVSAKITETIDAYNMLVVENIDAIAVAE